MIYDCHLHAKLFGDSNAPVSLQIEKVIELGMKEMCITDRHNYDPGFCDCDFILDIPTYLTSLHMLQAEYRDRIRIDIGIELGLQNHPKEYLNYLIKCYGGSLDSIIGPNHFVKSTDPYDPEYWNKRDEVPGSEDFFEASLVRARDLCRTFDSLGYLDYVMRYAPHQSDFYDH